MDREYERESDCRARMEPFNIWLRERCALLTDGTGNDVQEVVMLSMLPSRRVCSFKSMTSYGSHYRVEGEEEGMPHVTYDCGVAELQVLPEGEACSEQGGVVELIRVGTLKDILVFTYGSINLVLMVVSWVAKDTEMQPRLRRDAHGFWIANMAARPRCTKEPYILPELASQVTRDCCLSCISSDSQSYAYTTCK